MNTLNKMTIGSILLISSMVAVTGLNYVSAYNENSRVSSPTEVLAQLPISDLSDEDKARLIYGQQEERLARDVYLALYEKYGLKTFKNISNSEDRHIEAVGAILDKYGLPQTEGYGDLQSTYDSLIAQGNVSLEEAIKVGIAIELLDIKDLDESLLETQNEDIKTIYENLRKGSINHLNAFVSQLQKNGFETDQAWQEYTSQDQIELKGNGNKNGKSEKQGKSGKSFKGKNNQFNNEKRGSQKGKGLGLKNGTGYRSENGTCVNK